jgi:hypothetical protein
MSHIDEINSNSASGSGASTSAGKCPVIHGNGAANFHGNGTLIKSAGGGTSNRDWWPNI